MSRPEPLILHTIAPNDVPEARRRALEGLRAGRRVNVFTREDGSPVLLFSARQIGDRTFVNGPRASVLLDSQAGALTAGFGWMLNNAA